MKLDVDVTREIGAFRIDARLACEGGLLALFGRSGAGKTSLVNIIAGLLRPDRGRIAVGDDVLFDSEFRIDVPAHRRRVGYVFQEPRLLPHLSVRHNLLYGRWFRRARERYTRLEDVVELLGIGHLLGRRPARLSGGEKQRVAIGRALLASPRILLMDEPLASLDAVRKQEIYPYLERLRYEAGVPIVYVSHSIEDVMRLATAVALMDEGRITACGPIDDILSRPDPDGRRRTAGAVLDTVVAGHDDEFALTLLDFAGGTLRVPRVDLPKGSAIRVRIPASDVVLAVEAPVGVSTLNVLRGEITELTQGEGAIAEVRVRINGTFLLARLTRKSVAALALAPGRAVFALVKTVAVDRGSAGGDGVPVAEQNPVGGPPRTAG